MCLRSNISGVTMLAVPGDIYAYGTQIAVVALLGFPIVFLVIYLFLPVFYKLQYESSYEVRIQDIHDKAPAAPAVRKREALLTNGLPCSSTWSIASTRGSGHCRPCWPQ